MTQSPFKAKYFSLGFFDEMDHSFEEIIRNNLTPESIGYKDCLLQTGLQSRYQRYQLMSTIPIGIFLRTIREKFFQKEIK